MPSLLLLLLATIAALNDVVAFAVPRFQHQSITSSTTLHAKKKKKSSKSKGSSGGGFGSKPATVASVAPVSADKVALENQWDHFASITDLEIFPPGNPDDEDYEHFIVTDVFVRVGPSDADGDDKSVTGWYRTGKCVAAGETDINAALTLQKGLILWTAVHMWPQLAAKGKAAAQQLQLGFAPPSMNMADETDTALDDDEAEEVEISRRVPVQGLSIKDIGFRPDYNPPGFTYKRREKAAMKKKKSALEEIAEAS
ncbi:hypothetical protein ACHAXR_009221 [Thalassiosira sp. AJA248-18]